MESSPKEIWIWLDVSQEIPTVGQAGSVREDMDQAPEEIRRHQRNQVGVAWSTNRMIFFAPSLFACCITLGRRSVMNVFFLLFSSERVLVSAREPFERPKLSCFGIDLHAMKI